MKYEIKQLELLIESEKNAFVKKYGSGYISDFIENLETIISHARQIGIKLSKEQLK